MVGTYILVYVYFKAMYINASVKKICDIFVESAQTTFGRKPKGDKPCFNYECKFARKNYRKLKRKFKKERSEKSNGG